MKEKELMKLSKLELIHKLRGVGIGLGKRTNSLFREQYKNRHFRIRLLRIRNELDYLLIHPYSRDISTQTEKHPRDTTIRLSQLEKKSAKHNDKL